MVYVAAHVGFAGAMLNPFTIGIAQDMSGLPLFSGIEYRILCWALFMAVAIAFVLWYASRVRKSPSAVEHAEDEHLQDDMAYIPRKNAIICFVTILAALGLFCINYASGCVIRMGNAEFNTPWLLWTISGLFAFFSAIALKKSVRMFILNMLLFTIAFLVIGVMGYGWYLPEICALFLALAVASGISASYSADKIAAEFVAGAKDIFSAALIIGFAAGIIIILKDGNVIDTMLNSMADALEESGKVGALGAMYGIQTFINLFIPSASAKAAVTIPIMAPFSDLIGVSRQATVLAFQFGDGITNMITPCSGVLLAVLSVARIPYEKWFGFIWKFVLALIIIGFLLLIPTVFLELPGF
jgi:uncharacterized ion transporter superfamily protein YfcC